jgi:hypothetical protein
MELLRPAAGALAALVTAGLLTACGGEDNPISRSEGGDRPLTSSSASPSATSSAPSALSAPSATPSGSVPPSVGSPLGTIGGGVVVHGTGFTVLMPGEPEKSAQSAEGRITFDIYRYENDTATYTLTRGYYPKIGTLPTLRDAITSAAGQAGGKLTSSHELKYKHEPGIEGVITGVKLNGKDVTIFARYVVVDRVMYGLLYLDKNAASAFTPAFSTFVESLTF